MWSQGSHRKGGVLFLICQHWNKLSPSRVCVGSMVRQGLMEALVVCCGSASWPADQVRQNRKNLCLQLRQRVKDGIRAETCDCSQVTGDSARPYLDQQANETHGAGESMFSRPHGTQLSKINEFFCFDMRCPSVKMTRSLWQLSDVADKNSLSGGKNKSRNLGKRNVKIPA